MVDQRRAVITAKSAHRVAPARAVLAIRPGLDFLWAGLISSISFIFKSDHQVVARTLTMPVPYPPPNVESYTRIPSHHHLCSAVGAQTTSHLVVPRLPACMEETCLFINRR